jgi:GntR family transcriptional regulator, N-acetylglucosamine utilization regulator
MSISLQHGNRQRGSYQEIAAALREQITGGMLLPSTQLPAINELAREYRTTAITIRRALRMLEEQGLVRVEHGVGTFVADWSRTFDLLLLPSFAAEMAARDLRSETEIRGCDWEAHSPAAAALGLEPGADLVRLARLRRIEGRPVAFQRSYLPQSLLEVVEAYTPDRSLYETLRDCTGRLPVAGEERLRAVSLPEDAARELEAPPGAPGWSALRTTYDGAGVPLVYDEAYFAGDRVTLRVQRRANLTLLEYEVEDVKRET